MRRAACRISSTCRNICSSSSVTTSLRRSQHLMMSATSFLKSWQSRHDLAVIMGCCDLHSDVVTEDDEQMLRHVELIRQAARRMKDRIQQNSCATLPFERTHTA